MQGKPLATGLNRRATNCLSKVGIPIDREVIVQLLHSGKLYPHFWPLNYGKYTHRDVCRWAGVDPATLPTHPPPHDVTPYADDGLSYRAHRCLETAGLAMTKEALLNAVQTGVLSPTKRPSGYGVVTHAEVCRWLGIKRTGSRACSIANLTYTIGRGR